MLLFFRFFFLVLTGRFRRRVGALDESVTHFTVLPHDCDLNFHLNGGRFVSFMDIARIDLLIRMRILLPLLRRSWRPVMGGVVVRYRRSLLPFERFAIHSRIVGWDEKWFYIEHLVRRGNDLCATAMVRGLFRRPGGNVPPADVLALTGDAALPSPPLTEFIERWRATEDAR